MENNENMNEKKAEVTEINEKKVTFTEKHPKFVEGMKKVGKGFVKAVPYIATAVLSAAAGFVVGIVAGNQDTTSLVDDSIDETDETDLDNTETGTF